MSIFNCFILKIKPFLFFFIQDKVDDVKVGVKSTALFMGDQTKKWLTGFSATMIPCLAISGIMSDQCWPYYLSLSAISSHLAWQV